MKMNKQAQKEAGQHKENKLAGDGLYRNLSGFHIKPLYRLNDISHLDESKDLGLPGEYPFTRGVYETMYRGRPWTIRQLGSFEKKRDFYPEE